MKEVLGTETEGRRTEDGVERRNMEDAGWKMEDKAQGTGKRTP